MLIVALASQLVITTVANSIIKVLLVTHFGWIFSLDPQQLARQVLGTAVSLALSPNLAFTLWVLVAHCRSSNFYVAYLTGDTTKVHEINFGRTYLLLWVMVSIILAALVVFGIPFYLKRIHNPSAIRKGKMAMLCNNLS